MYRWVEHTAELEVSIEAPGEREVFADALAALRELLDPGADPNGESVPAEQRTVNVQARDQAGLLAAWLEELVFLAESEGFVGEELLALVLGTQRLESTVAGHLGEPPSVVKAVTYHRLSFAPTDGGYLASVVLDV